MLELGDWWSPRPVLGWGLSWALETEWVWGLRLAGGLIAVEVAAGAGVAVVVGAGVADEHAASNKSIRDNRDANGMQCFLNIKAAPFCF